MQVAKRSKTREQVTEAIDEISSAATSFDQIITQWMIASAPERSELLRELQSKGELLSAQAQLINESGWKNIEDERARTESLGKRATLLITVTLVLTLSAQLCLHLVPAATRPPPNSGRDASAPEGIKRQLRCIPEIERS